MKERPILFSGAMVRAILAGRKTQTRRVIKPQPEPQPDGTWHVESNPASGYGSEKVMRDFLPIYCPYGAPGDRLWVRETWVEDDRVVRYRADMPNGDQRPWANPYAPWRPSIHMPRWASRITLEVAAVRVERVQDISEADAEAEGVDKLPTWAAYSMRDRFQALWDTINAKRGYGWEANCWVWVVSFRRVQP